MPTKFQKFRQQIPIIRKNQRFRNRINSNDSNVLNITVAYTAPTWTTTTTTTMTTVSNQETFKNKNSELLQTISETEDSASSVPMSPLLFESDSELDDNNCSAGLNVAVLHEHSDTEKPWTNDDLFQFISGVNDISKKYFETKRENCDVLTQSLKFEKKKSSSEPLPHEIIDKNRNLKSGKSNINSQPLKTNGRFSKHCQLDVSIVRKDDGINKFPWKRKWPFVNSVSPKKDNANQEEYSAGQKNQKIIQTSLKSDGKIIEKPISNTSDVQIISVQPATIITIADSSETDMHNSPTNQTQFEAQIMQMSPDLFSTMGSQNDLASSICSFDLPPNQQNQLCEFKLSDSETDYIFPLADSQKSDIFEITTNNAFSNLICVHNDCQMSPITISDSPEQLVQKQQDIQKEQFPQKLPPKLSAECTTPTSAQNAKPKFSFFAGLKIYPRRKEVPKLASPVRCPIESNRESCPIVDLIKSSDDEVECIDVSQEITPTKRKSVSRSRLRDRNSETPKSSKSKWLSKQTAANSTGKHEISPITSLRRRRLDRWFKDAPAETPSRDLTTKTRLPTINRQKNKKNFISSSSDEECTS